MPDPKLLLEIQRTIHHIPTNRVVTVAYDFPWNQDIPHISSKCNPPFTLSLRHGIPLPRFYTFLSEYADLLGG